MEVKEFCEKYAVDRKKTVSLKWDALDVRFGDPDLISMWVADMDFKTEEHIIEALVKRAEHGVYGYSYIPDSYYNAVINWEKTHFNYDIKKEWIRVTPGIVASLYWFVNMYTEENDSVVILTPVYYPFHNCVKDNNRNLVTCDLNYEKGIFTIDYEGFEKAIVDNNAKMYILCSPHNPAGRVWKEEELDRMLEICQKHNVLVISDEIHQDLIASEKCQIPSATVLQGKYSSNMITCISPSKTFNLATCLTSSIIIQNDDLRATYDAFKKKYIQIEDNVFGLVASEAAYTYGEEWRKTLLKVIEQNYNTLVEGLKEFPELYISPMEGTYLALLNLNAYVPQEETKSFIQDDCRIAVDFGEWFGANFKGFVRMNLATQPEIVKKAVTNIASELKKIQAVGINK
jgi:cystathionine beta-lyase